MKFITAATALIVLLAIVGSAQTQTQAPASAPISDGDIAFAIDQRVEKLTLQGAEIAPALAEIGLQVGVPIAIDDAALDLLPAGPRTKLQKVEIHNASLRDALPQILTPIGMTYAIRDGAIRVVPTQPLQRKLDRATWQELELLSQLQKTPYTPEALDKLSFYYKISSKVDAPKLLRSQLDRARGATLAEALEVAASSLGWVWFVADDHIYIRTCEAQINNQLARTVSARYKSQPLAQIILDLANKADVAVNMEPGVMLKLPPQIAQSYTLFLRDTSIRQALELISAETGLKYETTREGLAIGLSDSLQDPRQLAARRGASTYAGKILVPLADGRSSFEVLVRNEDLPPDVAEYREQIIEECIQKLRAEMAPAPNAKPAKSDTPKK